MTAISTISRVALTAVVSSRGPLPSMPPHVPVPRGGGRGAIVGFYALTGAGLAATYCALTPCAPYLRRTLLKTFGYRP